MAKDEGYEFTKKPLRKRGYLTPEQLRRALRELPEEEAEIRYGGHGSNIDDLRDSLDSRQEVHVDKSGRIIDERYRGQPSTASRTKLDT